MFFKRKFNEAIDFIRDTVEEGGRLDLKSVTFRVTDRGREAVIEAVNDRFIEKGDQTETKQMVILDGFGRARSRKARHKKRGLRKLAK